LARVVATSWRNDDPESEKAISRTDRSWGMGLLAVYLLANIAVAWTTLA
jgi:hypothetical protein